MNTVLFFVASKSSKVFTKCVKCVAVAKKAKKQLLRSLVLKYKRT